MAKRKKKVGKKANVGSKKTKRPAKKRRSAPALFERTDAHFWSRDVGLSEKESRLLKVGALVLFVVMALLSVRIGLNGDDDVQANYSSELPSFYSSFGKDTTAFSSGPEIKYYGAVFEILTGATNQLLGFDQTQPAYFKVRHIWNAFFGAISIYFLVLFVGEMAGFRAALLATFFSFFTLRYLGHSLFNPKDIPFSAGYMVSIYFIYKTLKSLPSPSRSTWIGLTLGVALCIGVRIGGILVIAYAGLFLALHFIYRYGISGIVKRPKLLKQYALAFAIPSLAGLLISLLFWPYGLINPIKHIPAAFKAFDQFQYAIKVLFDGSMVWSKDIPLNYIVTWMAITVPLFTLVGLVLFLGFGRGIFKGFNPWGLSISIFAFAFPIIYVVIKNSVLYDGWRHFLFTYPPLMITVAISWHYLSKKLGGKKVLQYVFWGLLGLSSVDSLAYLLRNSTVPYTYFNPLSGGIKGAFGDYELDYWGASVKQAVEWMEEEGIISADMDDTINIASNFSHALTVYTKKFNGKVRPVYVRWRQRNDRNWDYAIFVTRFVDGTYLRAGFWPTEKTIHSISANGVPIAIIEKEDDAGFAFLGSEAIRKKQWDQAISYYQRELENYPNNDLALVGVGMAYLNKNQPQSAKALLDRALEITPESQNALNFSGYYHYVTGNLEKAKELFRKAGELHSNNATAFFYMGRIEANSQNYIKALEHVRDCIAANGRFRECYQLAVEVFTQLGDQDRAKIYQDALEQL